ncbi:MAG: sulfotransferase domain-containing protein, partial [Planctomycetota bacterium]
MEHPHIMIAGAQKCGTTSLFHWFIEHSEVRLPYDERDDTVYKDGAHLSIFMAPFERYDWLFDNPRHPCASGRVSVDISAELFSWETGEWNLYIKNPKAKVVILLRDPIERAWSHYWHNITYLQCEEREFLAAATEPPISTNINRYQYRYLQTGHYAEHLKRWLRLFDRKQLSVVVSERLWRCPIGGFVDIQQFM